MLCFFTSERSPQICWLKRIEDIFKGTHQLSLECMCAYFMEKGLVTKPLHTLIKLTPGCAAHRITHVDGSQRSGGGASGSDGTPVAK